MGLSEIEARASERVSPLRYLVVFVALVVLAAVSFGISRLGLGVWGTVISLAIAVIKATLVVLFFMHLWEHQGSSRLALATAVGFVILLMSVAVIDVFARLPTANSPGSVQAKKYLPQEGLPRVPEPNQEPGQMPVGP